MVRLETAPTGHGGKVIIDQFITYLEQTGVESFDYEPNYSIGKKGEQDKHWPTHSAKQPFFLTLLLLFFS